MPDSTARQGFPRRTQLIKVQFVTYGYTFERHGSQWLGKDDEELEKLQHAKERIDEYVAKQGEEQQDHKQEGEHTNDIDQHAVLEYKDV